MTECGHDRGSPGTDRGLGHPPFAIGTEPRAAVHRIGLHGEVQLSDVTRVQPEDKRSRTGDRLEWFGDSESVPDLIRHDVERKFCRSLEDQQLAGLVMWVPGAGAYLFAALLVAGRWLAAQESGRQRALAA